MKKKFAGSWGGWNRMEDLVYVDISKRYIDSIHLSE